MSHSAAIRPPGLGAATSAVAHAIAVILLALIAAGLATRAQAAVSAAPPAVVSPQPSPVPAPAPPAAAPPTPSADVAMAVLTGVANRAQATSNDAQLAAMAAQAAQVEAQSRAAAAEDAGRIADLQRAMRGIAPRGRRMLTRDQRAKLAPLQATLSVADAQLARARATISAANGVYDAIAERRREGFSARLLQRSASPLAPDFWTGLATDAGGDAARVEVLADDAASTVGDAPEPRGLIGLGLGLLAAVTLAVPVRWLLVRLGRRKEGEAVQPGLAHTGAAVWVAAVDAGAPILAAAALHLGAEWGRLLSGRTDALASAAVAAVAWAAAILALGRVLATDRDASQRLVPIRDDVARRARAPLIAVAAVTAAGFLLTRLNYVVGASVSATIATNCVVSLAYAGVAGLILISFGRGRAAPAAGTDPAPGASTSAWGLVSLALTAAVVVTVAAVFAGYTTLAAVVAGQIFWLGVIAGVAYLLIRFADDLCQLLFDEQGWAARSLFMLFNLRRPTIRQAGVLISAALQLVIAIAAVGLALTPFGASGELLAGSLGRFGAAIRIGSATISPPAVAGGLVVLFVGIALVHALQRWVTRRYLPVTDWDPGVRDSVTTGVGYIGIAVAVIVAGAAMGLDFAQIALIASALSVGIGFGLQQVVQNFISGLIVLVERPVKVGDWVKIDDVEGDIRRIRVRATEIQTFDRSTVIVPNSDLITKSVQNKTLGNPRGRIELTISIANAADAEKVRALVLDTAKTDERVLEDPPPAVYIDSIAAGGVVNFTSYLYLASPRDVRKVKSELYFQVLARFQEENIAFPPSA